ncbi:alpha/beta hydrolase [Lysobacter sp. GX 14042]|uniref:alpha/beta hydrolase n=1 Tax=Lysobacter sp. GX 14042 TaxID=2907155 RepID=UPI001F229854|nr:alpha/beta hydrolase [Lysobacter sp. GX 14042]MCE7032082.1 alpha/beta hydrolase [Lysobacter sp. GX 14042]
MDKTALLETLECETGPSPQWSVIWLHGLGADGNDFMPIVPELVRPDWPALRFVFPHAPVRPVTVNNGVPMRAWYDIRDFDLANRADAAGVDESVARVEALIAREGERGVPAERVILAGFSQGGAVTLAAGLRRREPLAGLVALSTYLPLAPDVLQALGSTTGAEARRQPVFMAHGSHDPVVPLQAGRMSAKILRDLGVELEWHEYPMAHQVCAEQIGHLAEWFGRRLKG